MKEIQKQYLGEYNHYCALTGWRGSYSVTIPSEQVMNRKQYQPLLLRCILWLMATGKELWQVAITRRKTVKTLIDAKDWEAAAYMMGYVLETALKAAACKSLGLSEYPDRSSGEKTSSYFMTHNFDQLLTISGFTSYFEASAPEITSSKWSEFLQSYPGDWPRMRYNPNAVFVCDSVSVIRLYEILYSKKDSLIKTIKKVQKW